MEPVGYSEGLGRDFKSAEGRFRNAVGAFDGRVAFILGLRHSETLKALFDQDGVFVLNIPTPVEKRELGSGPIKGISIGIGM